MSVCVYSIQITIPLNPTAVMNSKKININDGRPKALQVETSEITVVSSPISYLADDATFNNVLKSIKTSWLFSNANVDSFPHQANTDGNILPNFMEQLLSSGFKSMVFLPGETPTSEDACLMAWHLVCRCIAVNFVHEMSESGITRDTTPFVPDFPIDLWLFENLTNHHAKSLTPPDQKYKPKLHVVIDISAPIAVTIDHLELLFLMRLGDSLNDFQVTMERIFTFDESDVDQKNINDFKPFSKRRPSESQIRARKKCRIGDVDFDLSSCVVVKAVYFNATLPIKVKPEQKKKFEEKEPPTPVPKKCPILLKAPTIDEVSDNYNLPRGESYDTQKLSVNAVANITSPITLEADPSLLYAIKRSLPGSPRVLTPKIRSPSGGSPVSSSPTISHSASLSSMNIDDVESQFEGYQDEDYFVIESVTQQSSTSHASATGQARFESTAEFGGETSLKYLDRESTSAKHLSLSTGESVTTHDETGHKTPTNQLPPSPGELQQPPRPVTSQYNTGYKQDQSVKGSADNQGELSNDLHGKGQSSQTCEEGDAATQDTSSALQFSIDDSPSSITTQDNTHVICSHKEDTLSATGLNNIRNAQIAAPSQWQLQVSISNICAIPVINATGLTAKVSASNVSLTETPLLAADGTDEQEKAKPYKAEDDSSYDYQPSVKVRIELGPRIYNYYPTLEEINIPCVVQLHVTGVDAGLLLPLMDNLAMMFDDEIKSSISVPIYIILEGNQFLIMQTPEGHAEDFSSLNISVGSVSIQRGPEVPKLALWKMQQSVTEIPGNAYPYQQAEHSSTVIDSTTTTELEELKGLLSSINSFSASLQPQLQRLGNLPQAQRIDQTLGELQRTVEMIGGHSEPPPRYSESVDYESTSTAISALQKEIESLKQERQLLEEEVKHSQEQLQLKDAEVTHMVSELVKSKDSEVAMKQVLFQLNNQIQDVVMENDQYKAAMSRAGLQIRKH